MLMCDLLVVTNLFVLYMICIVVLCSRY